MLIKQAIKEYVESSKITIHNMKLGDSDRFFFSFVECWVSLGEGQSQLVKPIIKEEDALECLRLFENPDFITEDEANLMIMLKPDVYRKIKECLCSSIYYKYNQEPKVEFTNLLRVN